MKNFSDILLAIFVSLIIALILAFPPYYAGHSSGMNDGAMKQATTLRRVIFSSNGNGQEITLNTENGILRGNFYFDNCQRIGEDGEYLGTCFKEEPNFASSNYLKNLFKNVKKNGSTHFIFDENDNGNVECKYQKNL